MTLQGYEEKQKEELRQKREKLKTEGKLVKTVDELTGCCKRHPDSHFKIDESGIQSLEAYAGLIPKGQIPGYLFTTPGSNKKGYVYTCVSCSDDKDLPFYNHTKAHDCPFCGVVVGELVKWNRNTTTDNQSWEGEEYQCRVCGNKMGMERTGGT